VCVYLCGSMCSMSMYVSLSVSVNACACAYLVGSYPVRVRILMGVCGTVTWSLN